MPIRTPLQAFCLLAGCSTPMTAQFKERTHAGFMISLLRLAALLPWMAPRVASNEEIAHSVPTVVRARAIKHHIPNKGMSYYNIVWTVFESNPEVNRKKMRRSTFSTIWWGPTNTNGMRCTTNCTVEQFTNNHSSRRNSRSNSTVDALIKKKLTPSVCSYFSTPPLSLEPRRKSQYTHTHSASNTACVCNSVCVRDEIPGENNTASSWTLWTSVAIFAATTVARTNTHTHTW